jgi:ABC-type antimicrobial peptide transport system permease subunit
MTFLRLLRRNLVYHWRGNSAVLLGVAVGTAVLTGALLVGESLRGSLRHLTLKQLEGVDAAMVTGRFVREDLAKLMKEIEGSRIAPVIILQGAASTVPQQGGNELPRRVGRITVLGVDNRLWIRKPPLLPDGLDRFPVTGPASIALNAALANDLGVKPGDVVELHVQKASGVPRETLLGRRDEQSVLAHLQFPVGDVIADDAPYAQFSLNPSPAAPRTAFVPLALLQERLALKGQVNALLSLRTSYATPIGQLNDLLKQLLTLDDWGLALRTPASRTDDLFRKLDKNGDGKLRRNEWRGQLAEDFAAAVADRDGVIPREAVARYYREHRDYLSLESRQMLLEPAVGEAARKAAEECGLRAAPTLVYLANTIAANGGEIPYAIVAALDPAAKAPLGPFLPAGVDSLKDDEIILADWKESPLQVKPGDEVTLKYFEPVEGGQLHEKEAMFRLAGLVPMQGPADDPDLTPEFPGITDKLSIADWDPPFPYDNKRIKKRDEDYWKQHRTTPRAYVTLKKGQELWGSRFGKLTSIRLAPADEAKAAEFGRRLLENLNPEDGGFVFDPVRERALQASAGGNDFGGLFLGFSCFLIAAALLLVGLLFRLNLDRRASEIGLLLATGYRRRTVFLLLLAEGAIIAVVGGVVGLLLAVFYARLLLDLLRWLWPGGLEQSFLRLHTTAQSLAIGFSAAVLVSVGTILWAMLALRKVPPRALLAGQTTVASETATPRWSFLGLWVAIIAAVLGVALLPLSAIVHDEEIRASLFFGSGALLLIAALAATRVWLRSARHGQIGGHGGTALARLGVRNAARNPTRSLLTAGLLAAAAFLLVAVESFRRSAGSDFLAKDAGSGGYSLVAETDVPIYQDLNSDKGRAEISEALERRLRDQQLLKNAQEALAGVTIQQFRVHAGDDASCLNLYQPRKPRLLGVPGPLIRAGGFRFVDSLATDSKEKHNPWLLLNRTDDPAIPVIGEANTVKWMLHSDLGKEISVTDDRGAPVKLRIVGLLSDSVFQSGLLMSEKNFLRLYPSSEGYSFFLIETPPGDADRVKSVLETALGDRGFEVTPSARRLEAYLAVENMYLSTFQVLGGFGLLLGTLGLAVVLLRSVWERRGELALLRALGYRHRALNWLLLSENGFLLLLGLGIGTATALLAVAPHLIGGEGAIPWPELLGMLAGVLAVGLLVAAVALRATLQAPLVPALRRE